MTQHRREAIPEKEFPLNVATDTTSFREADIRPDHLKQREAELFADDVARLVRHKHAFAHVACPACDTNEPDFAFEKFDMTFVRCAACQTMYVNPRPTPEILDDYYSNSTYYTFWNDYVFPASEQTRREKIFRPRAERTAAICHRLGVATTTFLEVGAGFGTFCEELQSKNMFKKIIAIEPTPSLAETCRQRGIETIQEPIERVSPDRYKMDVVASFEVIEHLFSPADFIRRCYRLLAPGGLLILTCPNVKGFDIQVLGNISDSIDPEHLNYFHPESLSDLVTRNGFQVEEVSTPGKLDAELVRNKHLSGLFDLGDHPFLHQLLIERWERVGDRFQDFLVNTGLSSHLWLVARKTSTQV